MNSIEFQKNLVFWSIFKKVEKIYNETDTTNMKTKKGFTQNSEIISKNLIKIILDECKLDYSEAGSQQSKDFRIKIGNDITLYLEIKKTDTNRIFFNDTMPDKNIYYIILFTGNKKNKKTCIGVNGFEFIKNDLWVYEYQKKIDELKREYQDTTKFPRHNMFVYPRPTYSSDITFLLQKQSVKEVKAKINKQRTYKPRKNSLQ